MIVLGLEQDTEPRDHGTEPQAWDRVQGSGPKDQGAAIHPAKHRKDFFCSWHRRDPSTVELTHAKTIHCSSVAELLRDATSVCIGSDAL